MNHFAPSCKILPACLWQRGLAAGVILFALFALGSGCSTNGRYADGLDHWPVQVYSVDSGSN